MNSQPVIWHRKNKWELIRLNFWSQIIVLPLSHEVNGNGIPFPSRCLHSGGLAVFPRPLFVSVALRKREEEGRCRRDVRLVVPGDPVFRRSLHSPDSPKLARNLAGDGDPSLNTVLTVRVRSFGWPLSTFGVPHFPLVSTFRSKVSSSSCFSLWWFLGFACCQIPIVDSFARSGVRILSPTTEFLFQFLYIRSCRWKVCSVEKERCARIFWKQPRQWWSAFSQSLSLRFLMAFYNIGVINIRMTERTATLLINCLPKSLSLPSCLNLYFSLFFACYVEWKQ